MCIAVDLMFVFQHQDKPLKLQRKLRKTREVEAHDDWDMSDLVMVVLSGIILCSVACNICVAGQKKKQKALPSSVGSWRQLLMLAERVVTSDIEWAASGKGIANVIQYQVISPFYLQIKSIWHPQTSVIAH